MKKALTQTVIVFVAVNLMMASSTLAQNVTEEDSQPASKEAIAAEKEKAEVAAKVAQEKAKVEAKVEQVEDEVAQIQMEAAQRQMEAAQRQMEAAQRQMEAQLRQVEAAQKQLEVMPSMPAMPPSIPNVNIPLWQHSGGGAVLVIPAAELKVEDLATITEDMSVMSRIFAKKLSPARLTTGRGGWYVEDYNPFFGRDNGTIEAVYLEGYAALFLMKVNFLLSPLPEAPEEKETEEEYTDPLWTQMRQEIYAPEEADRRRRSDDSPEEKYDAEKVEDLKETLIKTLKHAANIRALKPDQSVILTVIGGRSQSTATVIQSSVFSGRRRSTGDSRTRTVRIEPGAETASFLPTVLTICAKKSDIDAFAKGELSFDQFRERTRIFTSYAKVGKEGSPGVEGRPVAHEGHSVF